MSKILQNKKVLIGGGIGLVLILVIVLVSSILFKSEKSVIKDAEHAAQSAFSATEKETNQQSGDISFYLPVDMQSSTQSENNILVTDNDQTFILFVNPLEGKSSQLNFQEAKATENPLLLKSFKSDEEFGFIKIEKVKDDTYELQVSAGGVKMTTQTSKKELEEDAKLMMEIVRSVKLTK